MLLFSASGRLLPKAGSQQSLFLLGLIWKSPHKTDLLSLDFMCIYNLAYKPLTVNISKQ